MTGRLSYWAEREDLAAAIRWAHRTGLHDGVLGHFALRLADADRFLVLPSHVLSEEASPASLVLCDGAGSVLEGQGRATNPYTAFLGGSTRALLHTHMPCTTALALLEDPTLRPIGQAALFLHGRIAYEHEYRGLVPCRSQERARIGARLAEAPVVLLGGHGVIVTGPTVAEALYDLHLVETAARLQLLAMGSGAALRSVDKDIVDLAVEQVAGLRARQAESYLVAAKRILRGEAADARP